MGDWNLGRGQVLEVLGELVNAFICSSIRRVHTGPAGLQIICQAFEMWRWLKIDLLSRAPGIRGKEPQKHIPMQSLLQMEPFTAEWGLGWGDHEPRTCLRKSGMQETELGPEPGWGLLLPVACRECVQQHLSAWTELAFRGLALLSGLKRLLRPSEIFKLTKPNQTSSHSKLTWKLVTALLFRLPAFMWFIRSWVTAKLQDKWQIIYILHINVKCPKTHARVCCIASPPHSGVPTLPLLAWSELSSAPAAPPQAEPCRRSRENKLGKHGLVSWAHCLLEIWPRAGSLNLSVSPLPKPSVGS